MGRRVAILLRGLGSGEKHPAFRWGMRDSNATKRFQRRPKQKTPHAILSIFLMDETRAAGH